MDLSRIRNFSIIAHIDHGKSTLADRFLDITGAMPVRQKVEQYLDKMDLERERGITIKSHSVRLMYKSKSGDEYEMNLIDTPGHVDFSYEVSRSLSASDAVLLVVDASQGVEAQTLANAYLASDNGLEIIPILNKIDLKVAEPDRVIQEIESVIGIEAIDALHVSAKDGTGVREVLEEIIKTAPPPTGDPDAPLKALIFDSWFDPYQGAMVLIRVFDGSVRKGDRVRFMSTGQDYEVQDVGAFTPLKQPLDYLGAGEVGYMAAGIKELQHARVGDTVTITSRPTAKPLPGFKLIKPMVFAGLYPTESAQYTELGKALEKLALNDSSISYEAETSAALGFGFRCGFLGMLHMEIVQERLEREFSLELVTTAPTVKYKAIKKDGEIVEIHNPKDLPADYDHIEEPVILMTIHVKDEHLGAVLKLCEEKRGIQQDMKYISSGKVILTYELPLNEMVLDFYSKLKTVTRGYASMDYEMAGFKAGKIVRLDILINGEPVDAMSFLVHKDKAYYQGKELVGKMRKLIPRQLFEVVIQASIGSRVISRESIKALRKNVTAKCYGGDITRKRKLLEKQKEGKKRMKNVGRVEIPQEAFLAVMKVE